MEPVTFSARPGAFSPERTWRLTGQSLEWSGEGQNGQAVCADIVQVRLFGSPRLSSRGAVVLPAFTTCELRTRDGKRQTFSSLHYVGVGKVEDRAGSFGQLIQALLPRVASANPSAVFVSGMPGGLWWLWAFVFLLALSACVLGIAIVADGAIRQDWGDLAIGSVMLALFGFSTWRLFAVIANGRARRFTPDELAK